MREVKKSWLFKPSFILCFMEQREHSPLLSFKEMNILEKNYRGNPKTESLTS